MSTSFKKQFGFSLAEVLIAVFLVGMIILVVSNIPNAINLVTSSKSDSIVRQVAAKGVEDLRLAGYESLSIDSSTPINDSRLDSLNNVSAHTLISACPVEVCSGNEEIKQASITISWTENGEQKTYQIKILIGKDGLK